MRAHPVVEAWAGPSVRGSTDIPLQMRAAKRQRLASTENSIGQPVRSEGSTAPKVVARAANIAVFAAAITAVNLINPWLVRELIQNIRVDAGDAAVNSILKCLIISPRC